MSDPKDKAKEAVDAALALYETTMKLSRPGDDIEGDRARWKRCAAGLRETLEVAWTEVVRERARADRADARILEWSRH